MKNNLFGLGSIAYWLFAWVYWIELKILFHLAMCTINVSLLIGYLFGLEILFPLVICIINMGLLIGYLFGLIGLGLRYYFI